MLGKGNAPLFCFLPQLVGRNPLFPPHPSKSLKIQRKEVERPVHTPNWIYGSITPAFCEGGNKTGSYIFNSVLLAEGQMHGKN